MKAEELFVLLRSLKIRKLKQRGHNITGICPNHPESNPSWGISTVEPHLHGCFACGFRGSLSTLLVGKFNYTYKQVANLLGRAFSASERHEFPEAPTLLKYPLSRGKYDSFRLLMMEPTGVKYLVRRGISLKSILRADLVYDRTYRRIVFPWYYNKKFCGASSRAIGPGSKGLAYFGLQKRNLLYLPGWRCNYIGANFVLVEGEIDALKVMQAKHDCVAALGHAQLTEGKKLLALKFCPNSVTLAFDNDITGRRLTEESAEFFLSQDIPTYRVNYIGEFARVKDPGELPTDKVSKLLKSRVAMRRRFELAM